MLVKKIVGSASEKYDTKKQEAIKDKKVWFVQLFKIKNPHLVLNYSTSS